MLTAAEQELLAALLECLIPSDEHGPGAVEAGVHRYVEGALRDAYASWLPLYRTGLAAVDAISREREGRPLAELDDAARYAVVSCLESHDDPQLRQFFELVRTHAIEGMFGDPRHGGNAGYAGWALIGFPGPKVTFTEADQALGVIVEPAWREPESA